MQFQACTVCLAMLQFLSCLGALRAEQRLLSSCWYFIGRMRAHGTDAIIVASVLLLIAMLPPESRKQKTLGLAFSVCDGT